MELQALVDIVNMLIINIEKHLQSSVGKPLEFIQQHKDSKELEMERQNIKVEDRCSQSETHLGLIGLLLCYHKTAEKCY